LRTRLRAKVALAPRIRPRRPGGAQGGADLHRRAARLEVQFLKHEAELVEAEMIKKGGGRNVVSCGRVVGGMRLGGGRICGINVRLAGM